MYALQYKTFCIKEYGELVDHSFALCSTNELSLLESKRLWKEKYPGQPFDVTLKSQYNVPSDTEYVELFQEWTKEELQFASQVSLPHFSDQVAKNFIIF